MARDVRRPGRWDDDRRTPRPRRFVALLHESELARTDPDPPFLHRLDDEVALRFFRLQQMTEGSIDLSDGEADPLKGPTDVGTAQVKDEDVTLSSLIDRLNERFGTNFTDADQLFFDQIRASAENNENIAEVARANSFKDFASYLDRMLDELFIARMEGNEEIFSKVMTDAAFRSAAHEHLASEIFLRVREKQDAEWYCQVEATSGRVGR